MLRLMVAWGLLTLAGCQCLEPVDEQGPDAGRPGDGGRPDGGGGLDGGAGRDAGLADAGECATSADCRDAAPAPCSFSAAPAARSCLDGRCVYDCHGERTCSWRDRCLSCDGGACQTGSMFCSALQLMGTRQGELTRRCPSTVEPLGTFTFRLGPLHPLGCQVSVVTDDGGTFAQLDLTGTGLDSTATVAEAPGLRCAVWEVARAREELDLGCGRCTYQLVW